MSVSKIRPQSAHEPLHNLNCETHAEGPADAVRGIEQIRRHRVIEHAGIKPAKARLLSLLGRPRTVRPQCVLLASEAGSGKTAVLRHVQRLFPDREERSSQRIVRSIIYCEVEPAPTLAGMQASLLTELGAPTVNIRQGQARNDLIKRYLSEFDTQLVLFDEVQHLNALARRDRILLLDWMKWISTAGKASVVLSAAMGDGRRLIEHDTQLSTRFTEMAIPRFRTGIAFAQFLLTLERSMPLRLSSGLAREEMQRAILDETESMQVLRGLTDGVVKVIQEAAVAAVVTGQESIDERLLSAWRECAGTAAPQTAGRAAGVAEISSVLA